MQPFFFGSSPRRLFGIHHTPGAGQARKGGVVVCNPFGPEYLWAHRALRELANRLADVGFHAIRFDYFGSGDSGGSSEEAELGQWLEDVASAIEEVRELSGGREVSLVGLRLGASLAALVGSRRKDIDKAVLWDPVVDGAVYLRELWNRHITWLDGHRRPRGIEERYPPSELLGTPVSAHLRGDIEALDLLRLSQSPARRLLLLTSDAESSALALHARLRELLPGADYQHLPGPKVWLKEDLDQPAVPTQSLQAIASWLVEGRP